MLHRGFKPAKCKTALKLVVSRIKLLKNKRDTQVKQLRRELAQLLESGQDRTARIRVEHVVREEKTMAAYELIEIYCELIAARLPIIESQKNCPIDLKEAIASVIFASPRCADLPELMDIRKHFTAKYGKEFISAAVELRPDSGVGRMLVEKLSAKAPDGQTKMKILSAIAEEHNIKWDPESFEEKELKPPEDLLNGPNTFEKASKMYVEPPNVQAPPNRDEKGPPNVQAPPNRDEKGPPNIQVPPNRDEKHDILNSHERNARSSLPSQNFASLDAGGNRTTTSDNYHPELKPSGSKTKGMEFVHSYSDDRNAPSFGRQNWNMEFKDATAAAQAAAESAERASMAARAAAELSSRGKITGQYYTESQKPSSYGSREEGPGTYVYSKSQGEHLAKDPADSPYPERKSRTQNEQMYGNEQDNKAEGAERYYKDGRLSTKKSSRSAMKSSTASIDDYGLRDEGPGKYDGSKSQGEYLAKDPVDTPYHERNPRTQNEQMYDNEQDNKAEAAERYYKDGHWSTKKSSRSASSKSSTASIDDDTLVNVLQNTDRYSEKDLSGSEKGDSEVEFVSEPQDGFNSQGIDYLGNVRIQKQPSTASLHSHSDTSRHAKEAKFFDNAAVFFDDSGSDNEDGRFDVEGDYKRQASSLFFSSPGRKSHTLLSSNTSAWSPRQNENESGGTISQSQISTEWCPPRMLSESLSSAVPLQADEPLPAMFDDSDGPSSESEKELDGSKLIGSKESSLFPRKPNVYSKNFDLAPGASHGFTESSFTEEGNGGSNRKPWLQSSSNDLDVVDVHPDKNKGIEYGAESQKKRGFGDSPTIQPPARVPRHQLDSSDMDGNSSNNQEGDRHLSQQRSRLSLVNEVKDNIYTPELPDTFSNSEVVKESSLGIGKELKFGTLTGGLRNKGYRPPPYTRSSSSDVLSPKQAAENTSPKIEQPSSSSIIKTSINFEAYKPEVNNQKVNTKSQIKSSSTAPVTYFDSDDDNSNKELPQQIFSRSQEPYHQNLGSEVNKSRLRDPIPYFDSDQDDSEEDTTKQTAASKARSGTKFSRRTKASPSNGDRSSDSKAAAVSPPNTDRSSYSKAAAVSPPNTSRSSYSKAAAVSPPNTSRSSYSKTTVLSKVSMTEDNGVERKSSPRSSHTTETPAKPRFQTGTSLRRSTERPKPAEQAASKPFPESKRSSQEDSLMVSAREQQSKSLPKIVTSGTESLKTSSSSGETPSKQNSIKQASHVHPKLPDYDTITAHLQSLRMNRQ